MKQNYDEERKLRLDQGFKTLIHDTKVLPMLLKSNVDELKDKSLEEILSYLTIGADGRTVIGKNTEDHSFESGRIEMDSVFDITIPGVEETISVIVNLEGQNNPKPKYALEKRAEYYMARLVSSQKGTVFKGDDYDKIQKVYSIWYILDPRIKDRNTVTRYSMEAKNIIGSDDRAIPAMDTFNILFVNIGEYVDNLPDVMAFVSILFSHMSYEDRKTIMKDRFNIVLDDILSRRIDDMASIGQDTYDKGYDKGYDSGYDKGYDSGLVESTSSMVARLVVEKNWSFEDAIEFSDVPAELRESVESEARKKLGQ